MADHPTLYADGVVLPADGFRALRPAQTVAAERQAAPASRS